MAEKFFFLPYEMPNEMYDVTAGILGPASYSGLRHTSECIICREISLNK